jgi:uncharacterized protein YukE
MSRLGMDIEAAEGLLRQLEGGAIAELANVLAGMNGTVHELTAVWHGQDANQFQTDWAQHQQNLVLIHNALVDLGTSLGRSISEQRATSGH